MKIKRLFFSFALAAGFLSFAQAEPVAANSEAPAPETGLTLEACYQEAIEHNPVIRAAKASFESATGEQLLLESRALPHINGGGLGGVQGPRYNTAGSGDKPKPFILLTGSFQQALYDASIPAAFRRGRVGLAIAEQNFNHSVLGELYHLRVAFYQALDAREGIAVQESVRHRLELNLRAQEDQLEAGRVSQREVHQATLQLAAIQPGLAQARSNYRQAQIDLAQHLGRDLGVPQSGSPDAMLPVPIGTLEAEFPTVHIPEETAYALAHRPDIGSLRELIAASKEETTMAEAGYYPQISFLANMQYIPQTSIQKSGSVVQAGNTTETSEIFYGLTGTWQIIDVGAVRGQTMTLKATRDVYEITLKQLEDDIPRQLVRVAAALKATQAKLDGSEKNIELADQNLRQVEAQVDSGDLPQLDFLNAQGNLLEARFNRLNALLENSLAIAQFDLVTGRYLELVPKSADGTKPRP